MRLQSLLSKTVLYVFFLIATGCVNLKNVNDYASSSGANIKKFEDLGYSFVKACNDVCVSEQLDRKQFVKEVCDCKNSEEADSVSFVIYQALKGYFDGLTRLSDNELTSYKFDPIAKALKEGDFGGLTINSKHVDAYAKIGGILTRAITDGYRKRKLSKYIGDANDHVKILLDALRFNLVSNLAQRLQGQKSRIKSYYFDLFTEKEVSSWEKKKILEEFNAAIRENDSKRKQILALGKGLDAIAAGHQQLYDNRNRLKAKDLRAMFSQYASDIRAIADEINKLKNED